MDPAAVLRLVPAADERDLVARCVAGDRPAQRQLFEGQKRRVHATLYRILGPSSQLEDLLQEVFLSVFRALPAFRGESSLATWIDRCAVRAAFAHIRAGSARRGQRPLELVADGLASADPSAEARMLAREATRRLYVVLDALPAKQRMAFALHAIDERGLPEVAELMSATLVATKARVWRARRYVEKRAKADPVLSAYLVAASSGAEGAS
jgi:RNA polymerase sigma-70 factor (ECF subfamily)